MRSDDENLESLLLDWEAGDLDEPGVERIREILRTDPDARTRFVQWRMIDAALKLEGDAGLGLSTLGPSENAEPSMTRPLRSGDPRERWIGARLWTVAAACLVLALVGRLLWLEFAEVPGRSVDISDDRAGSEAIAVEKTSRGIALVTRLVDVAWVPGQDAFEVGDALNPGRFAIGAGHAQIEFFCGATVILEGPAELDLVSATLAKIQSGRLRAHVTPVARGFSIEVGDLRVVDLGTEFGLSVTPEGADVQVFDGEVEVHHQAGREQNLRAGQALVRTEQGAFQFADATPERFLNIADLEARAENQNLVRFERWREWSERIRRDPRLIVYYAFDSADSWRRTLRSSLEPTEGERDGAIVGANRVPGRWPTKGALEFKRPGDRVRVQIPGQYGSLSFACWVKIDSLDRWYNSLFLTDGYEKGEPHWQILDSGRLFLSIRPRSREEGGLDHREVLSSPFWEPSMSGKWLHLASTFDIETNRVVHYLNGVVIGRDVIPNAQAPSTTRIGTASIGNWSLPTKPDQAFAVRNLNGRIDEFALFAAALTQEEVQEMYDHGKP